MGRWNNVVAPSALVFTEDYPMPQALSIEGIKNIASAFAAPARRACEADFRVIDIHAAHGYLIHESLSPYSDQRTDAYGESRPPKLVAATRQYPALPAETSKIAAERYRG
jgi:2,4-dienoyl-CoA reductase-like NADH-dependent reductase (Old Yellow Enzyme family)